MTSNEVIRDYFRYNHRPLTSAQIVADTNICYETVKKCLQDLQAENYVKVIGTDKGRKVYVYNRYKPTGKPYNKKHGHYSLHSIQEAYRRQIQKLREEWFDDLL